MMLKIYVGVEIFLRVVFVMIFESKLHAKNKFSLVLYDGLRPSLPIFAT
jgi:hypothetical protein